MLQRNGAFSSRHSVSIHNNSETSSGNSDLAHPASVSLAENAVCLPPQPCRQERNFRMRRQAAKITARDGKYPQRQKRPLPMAEIPAQTAYLDPTCRSAVRKDWVVVCAVTCEPVSTENSRLLGNLTGNLGHLVVIFASGERIRASDQDLNNDFPVHPSRELATAKRDSMSWKRGSRRRSRHAPLHKKHTALNQKMVDFGGPLFT
jgi:hypothetical protein